jgi:DDE superfamily endonuclease
MSGLDSAQLDELEQMVSELLEEPWDKGEGRPRELNLREALIVTCGYLRQNIIGLVWAEIFDVAQSTISRYITFRASSRETSRQVPPGTSNLTR